MPVSVTKKSRVFKVASETPVVAVDLTAPDLVAPEPAEPVTAEPVTAEPIDFDAEVAFPLEPEMWRGIELEPVKTESIKTDMPPLESDKEEESDSEMPPLCTAKCTDCDCSDLKNNKGLTINAMIEKAIEEHLSPQESANDADAENEDEDEDEEESDFKNIRPRTISDSIKETLEEHLNPKEPPSRPDYTLIIVGITLAIGLWHLYVSVNTGINTLNEF
jgi:vesicle coat complex subunit